MALGGNRNKVKKPRLRDAQPRDSLSSLHAEGVRVNSRGTPTERGGEIDPKVKGFKMSRETRMRRKSLVVRPFQGRIEVTCSVSVAHGY